MHGNLYGTPRKELEENLKKGFNVLMDVDVKGAKRLMKFYPDGLYFFIIPPDIAELERRLLKRNTDENRVIKDRLKRALEELKYKSDYKYVIENRDLEATIEKIKKIIEREISGS